MNSNKNKEKQRNKNKKINSYNNKILIKKIILKNVIRIQLINIITMIILIKVKYNIPNALNLFNILIKNKIKKWMIY